MAWWRRVVNTFRGDRISRDIDEELASHLEEAVGRGRESAEARRAFGSALRQRELSRDVHLMPWLESLLADAVFGWRQIAKKKLTSAAMVVSVGLAIGACTSAFRIIDALLLRPLPVSHPERLYSLFHVSPGAGVSPKTINTYEYPLFRQMRDAVSDRADLIAVSTAQPIDVSYAAESDTEKANLQYVSGGMFASFGLRPAAGRLFTEEDDRKPGAHPYAVISEDYWARRFSRDARAVGRTFRIGTTLYTIAGVCAAPFTGTDPGTVTDIFLPTMMSANITSYGGWLQIFVRLSPGAAAEPVRDILRGPFQQFREQEARGAKGMNREVVARFLSEKLMMTSAASGASGLQREYRVALIAIAVLVALVLVIACANVANLMTAQAAARTREMALRISIGAGQARLVRMMIVESAWLALLASTAGCAFAWWAAPAMVSSVEYFPGHPVRLLLPADWRVAGFCLALALVVMLLFGLSPALRASTVRPAAALRGGSDPHSRRRLMHSLIGVQTLFCVIVVFLAGLFVATFDRLSNEPMGFAAARLLTISAVAAQAQSPTVWDQAAEGLRQFPGVEAVALADWPLLDGSVAIWSVALGGGAPSTSRPYFLNVSPGWLETMKIPLIEGRDFRSRDTYPQVAIVNEAFAKTFFAGENPVGRTFEQTEGSIGRVRLQIVGLVGDARYRDARGSMSPVVYVPFRRVDAKGAVAARRSGTFLIRTSAANPASLAPELRRELTRARPELRVREVLTQMQIDQWHTARERLLARLALFFGMLALILAGVGLYGVLDYSVLQRRREIGIRMAIGARAVDIVRRVTAEAFALVFLGTLAGIGIGMASVRYVETLLYGVKATDAGMVVVPCVAILAVALVAALPAVMRAVRLDPVKMLRE